MITRRTFLGSTALATLFGSSGLLNAKQSERPGTVAWRNWSGGQIAHPAGRVSPANETALIEFLRSSNAAVRPVGSGHSFTALVPTEGHLLILDQLSGLLRSDTQAQTATFGAGTRLGDMGAALLSINQAMFNLPDIDRQTLAGATSTATHGTGLDFQCLSGYIKSLRLITPDGTAHEVSATKNPDLFDAARVSVGALGIITEMTIQNRSPYRLKQTSWAAKTTDLLDEFDDLANQHRHFEIFPLVHSDYSLALATDETNEPIDNPPIDPEETDALELAMQIWTKIPPRYRRPIVNATAQQVEKSIRVDESYKILANVRTTRFNEMEYSVPLEAGRDCLEEVLQTIIDKAVDVAFPLEYRYVARDDTMLSMSSGNEDHAAISIHRIANENYKPYFDLIEPIFWKYGGRPHWGKIHSLGKKELSVLYPRFSEFLDIRQRMDPQGRLLNPHLSHLFGLTT